MAKKANRTSHKKNGSANKRKARTKVTKKMYSSPINKCKYMDGRDLYGGGINITGKSYAFNAAVFNSTYGNAHQHLINGTYNDALQYGKLNLIHYAEEVGSHFKHLLDQKYRRGNDVDGLLKDCKPIMIMNENRASEDWCVLEFEIDGEIMLAPMGFTRRAGWYVYPPVAFNMFKKQFHILDNFQPNPNTKNGTELMFERMFASFGMQNRPC